MKPYLISLASYTNWVERYVRTLPRLEDSVEWVNVAFNPIFAPDNSITDSLSQFQTIEPRQPYPGNLNRFNYLPKLDQERLWIFTDTADVVFQAPIPDLQDKIYVCPEYDTWGADNWWKNALEPFPKVAQELEGLPIFNMGTWAMKGSQALEMIRFVIGNAYRLSNATWCDQPLFNLWLKDQEITVHPTLMACLYDGLSAGEIIKQARLFVNPQGEAYSIVHANGGTKTSL
jgi:hypothetical protein